VKWKSDEAKFGTLAIKPEKSKEMNVSVASVRWYPWGDRAVAVDTVLIPPSDQWPDWHVRMHRIRCHAAIPSLHTVEGGFAIYGRRNADGMNLPTVQVPNNAAPGTFEGTFSDGKSTIIASKDGCSGIVTDALLDRKRLDVESVALKPDSNTNIVRQRTLIPITSAGVTGGLQAGQEIWVRTSVFAISSLANQGVQKNEATELNERWSQRPPIGVEELEQVLHNM
jgi:hypothetical protein